MLHAGVTVTSGCGANKRHEVLSIPFMKKYIQYCKTRVKPALTQLASDRIAEIYVGLRNDEMEGNQRRTSPLTVRTLETLIRLATAHAKSRLSNRVEVRDAEAAEAILRFALFKEVVEDESRKKRRRTRQVESDSSDEESSGDDDGDEAYRGSTARTTTTASTRRTGVTQSSINGRRTNGGASRNTSDTPEVDHANEDLYDATPRRTNRTTRSGAASSSNEPSASQISFASSIPASQLETQEESTQENNQEDADLAVGTASLNLDVPIAPERLGIFRTTLGQLLNTDLFEDDSADVAHVIEAVNGRLGRRDAAFSREEAIKALKVLDEKNQIM